MKFLKIGVILTPRRKEIIRSVKPGLLVSGASTLDLVSEKL